MKPVYFVTNAKPVSYNAASKTKYEVQLREEFNNKYASSYSGLPTSDNNLKARVIYIHRLINNIPDIDNLSKPIIDAFRTVIYKDDCLIAQRTANIMKLDDFDMAMVDATSMPINVLRDFNGFVTRREQHIVFFGVSTMDLNEIRIGVI